MEIEVGDIVILPHVKDFGLKGKTGYAKEIVENRFVKVQVGNNIYPFLLKDVKLYCKMHAVNLKPLLR